MASKIIMVIALASIALVACGSDEGTTTGEDEGGVRTVEIAALDELRFDPETIEVSVGETVRFVVTNEGAAPHDFLIGDEHSQEKHEEEMQAGMTHEDEAAGEEGEHAEGFPEAFLLEPGETKEVEVTFDEAGSFLYGCHQPGHYDAGMVGTITVS